MQTIEEWLEKLGLSEYAPKFADNDVDLSVVGELTDQHLKDLGVSLGHRLKLLRAARELGDARSAAPRAAAFPGATLRDAAQRRQLTVMFCDLVGSTALSAELDPEDLREIISSYHQRCAGVITRSGGFVAKYLGDGVLAYFGYPQAHEDDAERAVRAGLALVGAVGELVTLQGAALRVRIGIATGLVVVGDLLGEGAAQEQAVIGDTPNLAARCQALAEPDTVVVSGSTRRLLGELFEYRSLGSVPLKGFAEPVAVWQVTGASAIESRFEALRTATTPLVGRDEEIDVLLRRWRGAQSGDGGVVLISGEAGIGKSRILQSLQLQLRVEPHTRLRFSCSPQHQDIALYPHIVQLQRAAGFRREDTGAQQFRKLEALLAETPNGPHESVALLADLLSIRTRDNDPPLDLSPAKRKERTIEALLAHIEGLAASRPMLLMFEDAHWIDPTSLELLDLIVERAARLPMLVIVTFRPEFRPPWVGRSHVALLSLNRLRRRLCADMIARVTGGKPLPDEIAAQIIDRTDGVPLFIEELTKAVIESGIVTLTDDCYVANGPITPVAIPTTLQASLLARLDRLAPTREVAQIAAALGRQFSHDLISAVAEMPQAKLDDALDQLLRAELIFQRGEPPDAQYTFKHALVQDAAYGTLLRARRQHLHGRIAATIELQFPEIAAAQPALLAQHYANAALPEPALKYWTIAGDLAERRAMSREAAAHYRAAAALLSAQEPSAACRAREPELLIKLGSVLQQVEGYNSAPAIEPYQRARAVARALDQPENYVKASVGITPLLFGSCNYQQVIEIGNELSTHYLDHMSPQTRVQLLIVRGIANLGIGQYPLAWEQTTAACVLDEGAPCTHATPIGGGDPAIVARGYASMAGMVLGRVDRSRSLAEDAVAIARARDHAFSVAWALLSAARFYRLAGRFADTILSGEEAIRLCERHGFVARMGTVLIQTGAAYFGLGETDRGLADIRRGLELWRGTSGRFHMSGFLADFADYLVRAGSYEEAEATLGEAHQVVAETDEQSHVAEISRLSALLSAQRGDVADAEAKFAQAIAWSRANDARLFELRALRDLARMRLAACRPDGAANELRKVLDWFGEGPEMPDVIEARDLLEAHAGPG